MKMYRQGDVLLIQVAELPKRNMKDITPIDRIVLAHGEVTGHAHAIYPEVTEHVIRKRLKDGDKPILKARLWDHGAERFLQVVEKTSLKHEEHGEIPLDKGVYRVVRQREYDPEMERYVAD